MGVLFDADISGSDVGVFGFNNVLYVAFHLQTSGVLSQNATPEASDRWTHLGFITLGNNIDAGDGVERPYWRPARWIEFSDQFFAPQPSVDGTAFTADICDRVRWVLRGGATGHLHVFGA